MVRSRVYNQLRLGCSTRQHPACPMVVLLALLGVSALPANGQEVAVDGVRLPQPPAVKAQAAASICRAARPANCSRPAATSAASNGLRSTGFLIIPLASDWLPFGRAPFSKCLCRKLLENLSASIRFAKDFDASSLP